MEFIKTICTNLIYFIYTCFFLLIAAILLIVLVYLVYSVGSFAMTEGAKAHEKAYFEKCTPIWESIEKECELKGGKLALQPGLYDYEAMRCGWHTCSDGGNYAEVIYHD